MFTGLTNGFGNVKAIRGTDRQHIELLTNYDTSKINIGNSIACSGVCLTVTKINKTSFSVDISHETLLKTTIQFWRIGTPINFEKPIKMGDEFGGHIVTGHVDGIGSVTKIITDNLSIKLSFQAPNELMKFIAIKGSISIDGVSLTINEVSENLFSVNIIPFTSNNTTLGKLRINDKVNIEVDLLARYIQRLIERD